MDQAPHANTNGAAPPSAGKRYTAPWVGWLAVAVVAALGVLTVILKA